ncbi:MAG TPA: zeta toxin family protein [Bacteroidales bacterium]|nr:zeta toxin family protein [Bacteroidales bacterium]
MRGDKLVIKDHHVKSAQMVAEVVVPEIKNLTSGRYAITIAGESGSGKSETAETLRQELEKHDIHAFILQQDDYFYYPPKTNAKMREKDINHVGTSEVKLDLLDQNIQDAIQGKDSLEKPLVYFDEDKVETETVDLSGVQVVIAEGTYTTSLDKPHTRVFIDRNYFDTKETRAERSREKQDEFLEKILKIEHDIIRKQREKADLIITKEYELKNLKKS